MTRPEGRTFKVQEEEEEEEEEEEGRRRRRRRTCIKLKRAII